MWINLSGKLTCKRESLYISLINWWNQITKLINSSIREGSWPDFLNHEVVTPIPKIDKHQNTDDLRPISGVMNLNKIIEKLISRLMFEDIEGTIDAAQYGNESGVSINHYLIKFVDKVLSNLDHPSSRLKGSSRLIKAHQGCQ